MKLRPCVILGIVLSASMGAQQQAVQEYHQPVRVARNVGQWHPDIRFLSHGGLGEYAFTDDGIYILNTVPEAVSFTPREAPSLMTPPLIRFLGRDERIELHGKDRLACVTNYYIGSDSARWRTDVPNYSAVRYTDVWPGIDIELQEQDGKLVQTIEVHENGKVTDIEIGLPQEGADGIRLTRAYTTDGEYVQATLHLEKSLARVVTSTLYSARRHIFFRTEYSFTFGGSKRDNLYSIRIDSAGNVYAHGNTSSSDFPVINAEYPVFRGSDKYYLSKFGCDGRMLYSTFLSGDTTEINISGSPEWSSMVLGTDDTPVISGLTLSNRFPLTGRALDTTSLGPRTAFLSRFTPDGKLFYSTYLGLSTFMQTLARGPDRSIYFASFPFGRFTRVSRFISPNALYNVYDTTISGVLFKLTPSCDSIIYGTFLRGVTQVSAILPDSLGEVMVFCHGSTIPCVNCDRPIPPGTTLRIFKLDSMATAYKWTSGFGGASAAYFPDEFATHDAKLDPRGNIHVIGVTERPDFPLVNPLQSSRNGWDGFLATFDSRGRPLYSTIMGSIFPQDMPSGIEVDACANRYVLGAYDIESGLVSPLDTVPHGRYLCVINATGDSVVFKSYWGETEHNPAGMTYMSGANLLELDNNGYLYVAGSQDRYVMRFNEKYSNTKTGRPAFISRLYLPYCGQDYLSCTLALPDTISFETLRRLPMRRSLRIEATVRNTRGDLAGFEPVIELQLPQGLVLDPPTQQLTVDLGPAPLGPGQTRTVVWTVRVDTALYSLSSIDVSAVVTWRNPASKTLCPLPYSRDTRTVTITHVTVPLPELACTFDIDSLAANTAADAYDPSPFTVRVRLRNLGITTAPLTRVVLRLPAGMGLRFQPPSDSVRTLTPLAPNENVDLSWRCSTTLRAQPRVARLTLHVTDTFAVTHTACDAAVSIPALRGISCALGAPDSVVYNAASGMYEPHPIPLRLLLRNVLDTLQPGVEAALDLTGAPALRLLAQDTAVKHRVYILNGMEIGIDWLLEVDTPQVTPSVQELRVRYRAAHWQQWQECARTLILVPPRGEMSCTLDAPVIALAPGDTSYAPAVPRVMYALRNNGRVAVHPRRATLYIGAPDPVSIDPPVPLGDLAPAAEATASWRLALRTSRFARRILLEVRTEDSLGAELTRCMAVMDVPGIMNDLACTLAAPDSVRYSLATDRHTPDPFPAILTLGNVLDTAQQLLEAEIDLSSAAHLTLAAGETARKNVAGIGAHGSATVQWTLAVKPPVTANAAERIAVRTRHAGDTAWRQCERGILIEGAERITSATCLAVGHDTVWADAAHEAIIPHPVQVQYTITNTGNVPLTGCSAAIQHSPMYTLMQATDSIQAYPDILPGVSVSREWLLDPVLERVQQTPELFTWVWSCDELRPSSQCTHTVTLVAAPPAGVVFTPWLLRFRAERNGPLPASQDLRLWTGGAAQMLWQTQSATTWLDWNPRSGAAGARLSVVPNSTGLAEGVHAGRIDIAAAPGVSPSAVRVLYDITIKTDAGDAAVPAHTALGQNYPNPADSYTTIITRLERAAMVRLLIFDRYGRLVSVVHDGPLPAGAATFTLDTTLLPPGMYWYTLITPGQTESRVMMVL